MSYQQDKFTEIANAIRAKTGTTDLIKPSEFASKISEIQVGGNTEEAYNQGVADGKEAQEQEFWDMLQEGGEKKNYQSTFANIYWTKDTFKPKYDVKPIGSASAKYMFLNTGLYNTEKINMSELEQEQDIVFDFSEATGNFQEAFRSCLFKELNVIDLSKATDLTHTFYNSYFTRIERLIFEAPFTHYGEIFAYSTYLTYIGFEGTIDPKQKNFNVSACPLEKESLLKLLNCLAPDKDGTYKLTLGSNNLAKLTTDEQKIATDKGWNLA